MRALLIISLQTKNRYVKIYSLRKEIGGVLIKSFIYKTNDGMHTVTLEAQGGKYAVWADNDFVKYVYLSSNHWMNEEIVELFGHPCHILVCGHDPEVFVDGKSLSDGSEYTVRKNEIHKAVHASTAMLLGAGAGLIAVFILILFLSDTPAEYASLPTIGIIMLIWGVIRNFKEKKLFR